MAERAWEILEEDLEIKRQLHLKCWALYQNYCYEFYKSEKSIEDIEGLASIESNIWACIYRAFEKIQFVKQDSSGSDTLTGDSHSDSTFNPSVTFGNPSASGLTNWRTEALTHDLTSLKELVIDMEVYRGVTKFEEGKLNI